MWRAYSPIIPTSTSRSDIGPPPLPCWFKGSSAVMSRLGAWATNRVAKSTSARHASHASATTRGSATAPSKSASPLDWPDATVVSGDAVNIVARLKQESEVPLRSHGSLSINRALMAAGLVNRVQVTLFPVITGRTGEEPIFGGADDFDLELIESRTLDGNTQELIYRPALHA